MLAKIKDISQKAKVVGDHARKVFRSIMDSVSYVGEMGSPRVSPPPHLSTPSCFRTVPVPITRSLPAVRALRNVWLWLVNVGKECNRELGTPYRRCLHLFDKAKDDCERAIPFLHFLCYIVVIFRPLCGLAKCTWGRRGGPLPALGTPTLAEIPSLHRRPPLLRRPPLHPVLPQEEGFRP